MSENHLHARRATVDDLDSLKTLWAAMRLPVVEMEKRLTEFQVAESADGQFAGALGLQIVRQHALLHSEDYPNFADADPARELFWGRIKTLAASHGVFRVWTHDNSPFWAHLGFLPADSETLERLPDEWKSSEEQWFTLELKNEAVINAALKNHYAGFMEAEKKTTEEVSERAKQLMTFITIGGFAVFFICLVIAFWLFTHRR